MLPIVARAFAELGYRRATTAKLAKRCGVRENVLYRAWPNKKAMFLAAIDHIWESSADIWQKLSDAALPGGAADAARRVLEYEARHHGESGLYRVIFSGLTETDDPEIAAALRRMYHNFHAFITRQVATSRGRAGKAAGAEAESMDELTGWALVGLATVASIGRELRLMGDKQRTHLYLRIGDLLLESNANARTP